MKFWGNDRSSHLLLGVIQEAPAEAETLDPMGMLLSVLILAVLGLGGALWFRWLIGWRQGDHSARPLCFRYVADRQQIPIPTAPILFVGLLLLLNLANRLLQPSQSVSLPENLSAMFWMQVGTPLVLLFLILLLWQVSGSRYQLRDYFLERHWREELKSGLQVMLLAMPPTMLLALLSTLWKTEEELHPLLQMLRDDPSLGLILVIILSAAVIAPLFEELMFRVLLLNGLLQHCRWKPLLAVLTISALFALVHGPYDAVQLLPLSLCLGACLAMRQSYLAVVFAHLLFNGFMLLMTMLWQQAELPG